MIAAIESVSENYLPGTRGYHSVIHLESENNVFIETGKLLDGPGSPDFPNLFDGGSNGSPVIGVSNQLASTNTDHVIICGAHRTH